MVEFNSPWKFISKDWEDTLKFIGLGALMSIIPLIGPVAFAGLSIKLLASVISKKNKIPAVFGDFGESIMEGLKLIVFQFIIAIPILLVMFLMMGSAFASFDENTIIAAFFGAMPVLLILFSLYILIVPALMCNYAVEKKFKAFFDFSKAFKIIFGKFGNYLRMLLVMFVYGLLIGLLSSVLSATVIGVFFLAPLQTLIFTKILGDWYAENA